MIVIRRLIWDSWNITHIARHDVTPDEVEDVCHGDIWPAKPIKDVSGLLDQHPQDVCLLLSLLRGKEEHTTSLLHIMPTQESSSFTLN